MDYRAYLSGIRFCLVDEQRPSLSSGGFAVLKSDGKEVELLDRPGVRIDAVNTLLPVDDDGMKQRLREVCLIPRMSTLAIGAIINYGVFLMDLDESFVNIGIWNGFTFLSGVAGNTDKTCIGVDNFSQFGGPREAFQARFERMASRDQRYYDMDYLDYFARHHREEIGFYIYDGEHSYENQLLGLQVAEPFFSDDCLVLVDDTNWSEPRRATLDFMRGSKHAYDVLLDKSTPCNGHPTWWNGVMVMQRVRKASFPVPEVRSTDEALPLAGRRSKPNADTTPEIGEADGAGAGVGTHDGRPLLSIIVDAHDADHDVARAIPELIDDGWTDVEVIVVVDIASEGAWSAPASSVDELVRKVATDQNAQADRLWSGLDASAGRAACFVDPDNVLNRSVIAEILSGLRWKDDREQLLASIGEVIPSKESFLLVDLDTLGVRSVTNRSAIPFLERDGQYWGPPPDDETAIRELERMRAEGASYMVFAWPAFWWLDHYLGFRKYLEATYARVLANERLVAFDLRSSD